MKITLSELSLKNFKGIKSLKIEFGNKTNIKGENGAGKSTVVDAFHWLLFDKNSMDQKNFDIKTFDKAGKPFHGLEHSVEGILNVGDRELRLSKIYKEKWTKQRGMATKTLSGHETIYSINEIPVKKSEYEAEIKSILDEKLFKLITNPHYFASLKWKEQREIIQEIIGAIDDEKVINYSESLSGLKGKYEDTVENHMTRTKVTMSKLKDKIKQIPFRIDECNNNISKENFEELELQKARLEKEIEDIELQLEDSSKGNEILMKHKQHLYDLKQELQDKVNHARLIASKPLDNLKRELQEKTNKINEVNYLLRDKESQIKFLSKDKALIESKITIYNDKVSELRDSFRKLANERFTLDVNQTICPTCKRELENKEDIKNKLEENFNLDLVRKKEKINAEGKALKNKIKELEEEVNKKEDYIRKINSELEVSTEEKYSLEKELRELEIKISNFSANNDIDFEGKVQLEKEIEETNKDIANFKIDNNLELKATKQQTIAKLDEVKTRLNAKANNLKLKSRIEELEEEEKNLSVKLAEQEGQIFLCEEFIRTKVELSEGLINNKFKTLKFKLFNDLINGGLEETCEILIDGVPYSSANSASQINAGLEVINTLSNHYGVQAPIFIDNRESVNEIIPLESQLINLSVSKDPNLEIEVID
ncbi:MAG: ATP-binding protein [Clostridium sp.]|uniref:AAA family ATPase n=1 Tax=Clostridium sp. TaxID=1506 RepID=UPI003F365FC5